MPRISYIWAFIAEDTGPDDEGIPAFVHDGMMMPLLASDNARLVDIRRMAQHIATTTGKTLHLVRFTNREAMETVTPIPSPPPEETNGHELDQ